MNSGEIALCLPVGRLSSEIEACVYCTHLHKVAQMRACLCRENSQDCDEMGDFVRLLCAFGRRSYGVFGVFPTCCAFRPAPVWAALAHGILFCSLAFSCLLNQKIWPVLVLFKKNMYFCNIRNYKTDISYIYNYINKGADAASPFIRTPVYKP